MRIPAPTAACLALLAAGTLHPVGAPRPVATHRTPRSTGHATGRRRRRRRRPAAAEAAWLQPPPVLPIPSRSGPEGPPRPFGAEPPPGAQPAPTGRGLVRAQNRALLFGPFPHGGLARGVSDGTLFSIKRAVRELALTRIRDTGATTVRIPVDWRDFVAADPPAGLRSARPGEPGLSVRRARRRRGERRGGGSRTAARRLPCAGLRRSPASLALRLPRQLGAEPDSARRIRRRARPSLRRLLPRPRDARSRVAAREAVPGLERAQPGALSGAPVGRRGRALERLFAAALPPAAQRFYAGVKSVQPADVDHRRGGS